MPNDIGPKIGLDGEREFKNAIKDVNASLSTLNSEMKLVTSEFTGNKKTMEQLEAENEVYEKQIGALSDKLSIQTKRLEEATEAYGENDSRVQKLQAEVNKTQAQINEYSNKLEENNHLLEQNGQTDEELAKQVEEDAKKQKEAHEKTVKALEGVGIAFAAMATAATAAIAGAVAGALELGKSLANMTINAGYAADDLNTMAKVTGLSTEELQKFQFASDLIDVSVETLSGSMTKLTSNMSSAASGSGAAYEAFEALGIQVTDQNGELRDRNEVFDEAIKALGEMENETERDAAAMKLFGKSAKDLNPLIMGGADALEALGNQAEQAGLILSEDDLYALNEVSDAMDRFKATTSAAGNLISVSFADVVATSINTATNSVQTLTAAFSEGGLEGAMAVLPQVVDDLVLALNEELPAFLESGSQIIGTILEGIIAVLPTLTTGAVEILTAIVGAIIENLPTLADAALEILGALSTAIVDNLDTILDVAVEIILMLVEGLIDHLPEIVKAGVEIILKLVDALVEELPELIPVAIDAVLTIVDTLTDPDTLGKLIDGAIAIIIALANGLIESLPELIKKAPEIVANLVDAVIENAPKLLESAAELIVQIGQGIIDNFPALIESGKQIVEKIWEGLGDLVEDLWEAGDNIVQGIWQGISDGFTWIKKKIRGWIDDVLEFFKDLLGIDSPSKVFAEYGKFLDQGLVKGIEDGTKGVTQAVGALAGATEDAFNPDFSSALGAVTDGLYAELGDPQLSMGDLLAGTVNGMQAAVAGMGGGSYTFNLVMPDGTLLASYMLPNLIDVARAGGTPILNPA